jgi:hypothetical protein
MQCSHVTAAPLRYLTPEGGVNPQLLPEVALLRRQVHALYTHWVAQCGHRQDFTAAVGHHARNCSFPPAQAHAREAGLPPMQPLMLAEPALEEPEAPVLRFVDDHGRLNQGLDTLLFSEILGGLRARWRALRGLDRDFLSAVDDAAHDVLYDHRCAVSFGSCSEGAPDRFLTSPYATP